MNKANHFCDTCSVFSKKQMAKDQNLKDFSSSFYVFLQL